MKNLRIFVVMVDYCFDMNWYFAEVGGTNHEVGTKADRVFLVHKFHRLCMWKYHKWLSYLSSGHEHRFPNPFKGNPEVSMIQVQHDRVCHNSLKISFLFPRWDILVPERVFVSEHGKWGCLKEPPYLTFVDP